VNRPAGASDWRHAVQSLACQPPLRARVPLWAAGAVIGSVEDGFAHHLSRLAAGVSGGVMQRRTEGGIPGWEVVGELTSSLALLAAAMRDAGLAGAWRDEQLAVTTPAGTRVATVERAAVRPLGIATCAVHLLGTTPDGRHWVQQRSLTKANDPGLWDTLVGGMVPAADSLEEALARETWEEAGLQLSQTQALSYGGSVTTRRPGRDGGGCGYVVERIDWYRCVLPPGVEPSNRDGEVSQFALLTEEELVRRLGVGEFAYEAALLFCAAGAC
jgi:8-oxo-dGTP pyrophosphatase MutT (NUDIX family)